MTSAGYGICGHKNSFSTGVKLGNYVEDRFGYALAQASKSHPISRHSEASASFIDPRDMPDKSAHAPKEDLNQRAMIRAGLPYNLIFEHGQPHNLTPMELTTKYTPSSTDIGGGLLLKPTTTHQEETLSTLRELKRKRDAREQRSGYITANQSVMPATVRSTRS
ncbi:hypothetical protein Poli38472_005198 [Pythium oligandrum]|uniref:Uncharacterized protein n=1 Tax=Pythium oligandrum TaxID=41045 RepID=A0A8K1FGB5_PYTOL|nr:hypothetical protein Poli38472_005198 [Pythium oligandrum]|eukprot:TMW62580.1 hypothetical protein Poli38472_005198 [Pythium oligandrum]